MACQQEYAERNSTERDNALACSLQMPGEQVLEGCWGLLKEQKLLDPSSCWLAGILLATHMCWSWPLPAKHCWCLALVEIFTQRPHRTLCRQKYRSPPVHVGECRLIVVTFPFQHELFLPHLQKGLCLCTAPLSSPSHSFQLPCSLLQQAGCSVWQGRGRAAGAAV